MYAVRAVDAFEDAGTINLDALQVLNAGLLQRELSLCLLAMFLCFKTRVILETLRFSTVVLYLSYQAAQDEVVPLCPSLIQVW